MVVEIGEKTGWQDLMNAMDPVQASVEQPAPQNPPDPVQPSDGATEAMKMTVAQTTEMRNLAQRMPDPSGKQYLLSSAVSGMTYVAAQEIIDRAKSYLGVA